MPVSNWIPSLPFCLGVSPLWPHRWRKHCLPQYGAAWWCLQHLLSKMSYPASMLSLAMGIQVNISLLCMFMQMFSRAPRYFPAVSSSPWACDSPRACGGCRSLSCMAGVCIKHQDTGSAVLLAYGGWEIKLLEEEKLTYFLCGCSHHWATVCAGDSCERTMAFSKISGGCWSLGLCVLPVHLLDLVLWGLGVRLLWGLPGTVWDSVSPVDKTLGGHKT